MEINKSKGKWYNGSTLLEDHAYYLYLRPYISGTTQGSITQDSFITLNKYTGSYQNYFDYAKLILRKEKIKKILNHGNK